MSAIGASFSTAHKISAQPNTKTIIESRKQNDRVPLSRTETTVPMSRTAFAKRHIPWGSPADIRAAYAVPPKEYGQSLQRNGKQKWNKAKK